MLVLKHFYKCFKLCFKHLSKCLPHDWWAYAYYARVHERQSPKFIPQTKKTLRFAIDPPNIIPANNTVHTVSFNRIYMCVCNTH